MDILSIILIAGALSCDAFAVAMANGAKHREMSLKKMLVIALFFGFFQFLMPFIGFVFGGMIGSTVSRFDHWIAFILLSALGIKFIIEARGNVEEREIDTVNISTILLLSIATSVDALVVGLSFSLLRIQIIIPALIIGFVTLVSSVFAVKAGKMFGDRYGKKAEFFAGFVLIFIGAKILFEHLI